MSRSIECFLIEPVNRYQVRLRRYRSRAGNPCPYKGWCHNADGFIGVEDHPEHPVSGNEEDRLPHVDARWPKKCDRCDYVFEELDEWQINYDQLYRAPDGKEYTLLTEDRMTSYREDFAPVGAMWRATWMEPATTYDQRSYVVRTPGGDWHIDGAGGDRTRWARSGVEPKFTARPSILIGKRDDGSWVYHGFLTDGRLEEC